MVYLQQNLNKMVKKKSITHFRKLLLVGIAISTHILKGEMRQIENENNFQGKGLNMSESRPKCIQKKTLI